MTQPFVSKLQTLSFIFILAFVFIPLAALAQGGKPNLFPSNLSTRSVPASAATLAQSLVHPLAAGIDSAQSGALKLSLANQSFYAPGLDTFLFLPSVSYDTGGTAPPAIAVGDLNGDGKQDLVVVNGGGGPNGDGLVAVLLGNGDGSFQPAVVYDTGTVYSNSVAIADLRGDGKFDIVVGSEGCPVADSDCVSVLLGNGDGTFQPAVLYSGGGGLEFSSSLSTSIPMAVVDVNGDGKLDILIENQTNASYGDGVIGVLLGNGDGTFKPAVAYDTGAFGSSSFAVADVNGDGKPDLVVVSCGASGNTNCPNNGDAVVTVLLSKGNGSFHLPAAYSAGASGFFSSSLLVKDVNGDGKPDLLVGNYCAIVDNNCVGNGSVGVLLNNGNGTFRDAVSYDAGGFESPSSIALADLKGDGNLDLIVANGGTGVLLGNGDGTFQPVHNYFSTGGTVVVTDATGDGKLDIMNLGNPASVLPGNGDGTFEGALSIFGSESYFITGIAADVNGDRRPDLISSSLSCVFCSSGVITVQLNNPGFVYYSTTTALVSNKTHPNLQGLVTYTATVTSQSGGPATGIVYFSNGKGFFQETTLVNNQATASMRYETLGTYTVSAVYTGDGSNGSSSGAVIEYVQAPSTTGLTTSGSPVVVGQPVTFTATVTVAPKNGTVPDGELVTFYDGSKEIGTGTTASGVATVTTSALAAGTHYIKATYSGDATLKPSTGKVEQVVSKYATTTALVSSLNPSNLGQTVTFTATVTSSGPNIPTGYVLFKDGTTTLGSKKLSGGVAVFAKSNLATGTHSIVAEYEGDAVSAGSSSVAVTQVVN